MTKQEALDELKNIFLMARRKSTMRYRDAILSATDSTYRLVKEYIKNHKDLCEEIDGFEEIEDQPWIILNTGELQQIVDLFKEVDS